MVTKKIPQATTKPKKLGLPAAEIKTAPQRAVLAVQAAELMAGEAAERQRDGGKTAGRGRPIAGGSKVPKLAREPKTTARAAKAAGAGEKQVEAMKAVKAKAPEVFKAVQAGEVKTVAEPPATDTASLTIGETPSAVEVPGVPIVAPGVPATAPIVTELPIASIRLDGGTQSRASLSTTTIAEYAEAMTAGAKFPPVVVFFDGRIRWLADGFHRVGAHTKLGHPRIECDVRQGSQRDAILFSVTANATHGLRRSTADKKHAVSLLLRDAKFSKKSDRAIGELCGVDHKTVAKRREEISAGEIPHLPTTREGRDGKQQPASKPKPRSVVPAVVGSPMIIAMAPADEASALAALQGDIERHAMAWSWGPDSFIAALKAATQTARGRFSVKEAANG